MATLYHKRCALYIRVSSDEQARHGFSLGEQRIDLEQYAKGKGYDIMGLYADEGASARKAISRRHELQRLLRDVEAGLVDIIVMKCLDRWMRSVRDFYKVQDILDKKSVALEFTQEPDYNTSTTQGRLMLNLKLSIAQHESDQTSDRIKYVFAGMKRDGQIVSSNLPFGYRVKEKKVVIDEREAEIVRFMFSHVIGGNSVFSLMDAIYDKFGVTLKYNRMAEMIRNEKYKGTFYGIEDFAEPIISKEDFDKAQAVLSRHPRDKHKGRTHLFSGIIVCPVCGRNLVANYHKSNGKYRTVYVCRNHRSYSKKDETTCTYASGVTETKVEKYLVENISRLLVENVRTTKTKTHSKKKSSQTLDKVSRSLERLNEIYVLGNITKEAYKARYEALKKQERILLAEAIPHAIKIPAVLRGDSFQPIYETWSREERRAFWQGLIRRIEFPQGRRTKYSPIDLTVYFF